MLGGSQDLVNALLSALVGVFKPIRNYISIVPAMIALVTKSHGPLIEVEHYLKPSTLES